MVNSRLIFQSYLVYLVTGYLPNTKLEHCYFTSLFRASRNNDRGTSEDLILNWLEPEENVILIANCKY
jgi:hypothetical protein